MVILDTPYLSAISSTVRASFGVTRRVHAGKFNLERAVEVQEGIFKRWASWEF